MVITTHPFSSMCMCFTRQYQLMFECRREFYLYSMDIREKMFVKEMLVINTRNFHVADTGFFGTLDEVMFDSSSFCARKMKTRPFFST